MGRLRRRLSSYTITPAGWFVVGLAPVAILLAIFGPSGVRTPAFVVAVILLLAAASEGAGAQRRGGLTSSKERQLRITKASRRSSGPTVTTAAEADEDAWQRERERRERDGAST